MKQEAFENLESGDIVQFRGEFVPAGLHRTFAKVIDKHGGRADCFSFILLSTPPLNQGYDKINSDLFRVGIGKCDIGRSWGVFRNARHFENFVYRSGERINV